MSAAALQPWKKDVLKTLLLLPVGDDQERAFLAAGLEEWMARLSRREGFSSGLTSKYRIETMK